MQAPTILTDRLRLRPLTLQDKEPLMAFFDDPVAMAYLPMHEEPDQFADWWLQRQLRRYESTGHGLLAVELRSTGTLVGQCGLIMQFVDGIPKLEIGYHLIRQYWGQGYATEAAMACRDYCFTKELAETLISLIDAGNSRSVAVATRNGMTFWKDTVFKGLPVQVYRIRRSDWEMARR
ncbi:MAG: hypothetical protein RLY31_2901 [Bacteroidota bacterium]|jgi:RimJ/RimL family protein N-acetyltransferase